MKDTVTDGAIVHIIDDDDSFRTALDRMFRSAGVESRTYATANEFLEASLPDMPGCIVLDVRLPGVNGLDLQGQLGDMGVKLPVVLITGHGDIPMSVRAMKAGAVDFLPKPFLDRDMMDAVSAAIDRDRKRRAAESDTNEIRKRFVTLSPREQQVMMLVIKGRMNKQVAADLNISEVTVKIHRGAAMRKMGARTYADLVRMADILNDMDPYSASGNT